MRRRIVSVVLIALITSIVGGVPSAYAASAATVGNGIVTTDLNAIGMSPTTLAQDLAGATAVTVNGVAARFTVLSNTSILAAIPVTATGKIAVTTAGGTGTSAANFTYSATAAAPTITSFTATSASAGGTVTITGTNLAGVSSIAVGGVAVATWRVVSATSIQFIVPVGAVTGTVSLTTPGGTATSALTLTII